MSLGAFILQEHPSRVYQTVTLQPEPKIYLIQNSLDISDQPFSSSEILTPELLLPPIFTPTNTTIMDEPI